MSEDKKVELAQKQGVSAKGKAGCGNCSSKGLNVCMCPPAKAPGSGKSGGMEFNPEIINRLLSYQVLEIVMNKDFMDFKTLSLECNSRLLNTFSKELVPELKISELDILFQQILKQFNDFKMKNNLSDRDCSLEFKKDHQNYPVLKIKMKDSVLFDKFIEQLNKQDLLPTKNRYPTPFSIKPTPGNSSKRSPFKSLEDGPTPWKKE